MNAVTFRGDASGFAIRQSAMMLVFALLISLAMMGTFYGMLFLLMAAPALALIAAYAANNRFTLDDDRCVVRWGLASSARYDRVVSVAIAEAPGGLVVKARTGRFTTVTLAECIDRAEGGRLEDELERRFPGKVACSPRPLRYTGVVVSYALVITLYAVFHVTVDKSLPEALAPVDSACTRTRSFEMGAPGRTGEFEYALPARYWKDRDEGGMSIYTDEGNETVASVSAAPIAEAPRGLRIIGVSDMFDIYRMALGPRVGALPLVSRAYMLRGGKDRAAVCYSGGPALTVMLSGTHLKYRYLLISHLDRTLGQELSVTVKTNGEGAFGPDETDAFIRSIRPVK